MKPPRVDRLQTVAWTATGAALIALLWLLGPILTPFVVGAVFAYICDPAVNWMVARRVPRPLAVLLVICALGLLLIIPANQYSHDCIRPCWFRVRGGVAAFVGAVHRVGWHQRA